MEIQKKEIIIKPKRKKMDDSKNGDYFLFCRNKKCNQPIYNNRSHFDTRYCDECCQKGNMENNKKVKLEYIDGKLGFDFQDFFITDPFVSCCMRWEVDPIKEYGLTKEQIKKFKKIFTNRNRKKGEKNGKQLGKKN